MGHILELKSKIKALLSYLDQSIGHLVEPDEVGGHTTCTGQQTYDPFPLNGAESADMDFGYEPPLEPFEEPFHPYVDG